MNHAGTIRFTLDQAGHTQVHLRLSYIPPAGMLDHNVSGVFGANPQQHLHADLMRMKTSNETGVLPRDAAVPAHRRWCVL